MGVADLRLAQKGGQDALTAVAVADYDHDGLQEILVTGYATNVSSSSSQQDIIVGILAISSGQIVEVTPWYSKNLAG